jgi:DnaK suppressor protein
MKETVSKTAKKTKNAPATATKTRAALAGTAASTSTAKVKPASRAAKPAATRSAVAKAASAKTANAAGAKAVPAKAAVKGAVKATAKTAAVKATAAKPAKSAAAAVAKQTSVKATPAKAASARSAPAKAATVKATVKAASAKAAPAKETAMSVKTAPRKTAAAPATARATKEKTVAAPATAKAGKEQEAGSRARALGARTGTAELADKIETPVVSKVSEVMTKTTKPNTAAQAEERILTEDEIRAMSDEDYMNPAQLAFFKAKLQALEKELLKNAGETTEHLRETVLVPDPADRATIEEEHALELRTRDRERKLLKKVQQSLAAIEAGDYGWCEETGEPIGIPRLIARPTATLSLEAQQRRELKQKLYGD